MGCIDIGALRGKSPKISHSADRFAILRSMFGYRPGISLLRRADIPLRKIRQAQIEKRHAVGLATQCVQIVLNRLFDPPRSI